MATHVNSDFDAGLAHLTDDELRALFARVQSELLDRHAVDSLDGCQNTSETCLDVPSEHVMACQAV